MKQTINQVRQVTRSSQTNQKKLRPKKLALFVDSSVEKSGASNEILFCLERLDLTDYQSSFKNFNLQLNLA